MNNSKIGGWDGSRANAPGKLFWIYIGLMIAILLLCSVRVIEAQEAAVAINIPSQPLGEALKQLSRQTPLQLFYTPELVVGKNAPAVHGRKRPEQALDLLLEGSGLEYRRSGTAVTLEPSKPRPTPQSKDQQEPTITLPQVTVQDTADKGFVATRNTTGTKTDTPLIETPQAVSVVTREQMEAQNVQSVPEALRYTSGIVAEQRGINTESLEYLFARGFQIDEYLNGLRLPNIDAGFNIPSIDAYHLERVELLHGPASVLYGQASPGGLVNLISKRPTAERLREVMFQTGSHGRVQGGFDFGGAIDSADQFLYRFTSTGFATATQVHRQRQEKFSLAPAFAWQPNIDTRLTILTSYQYDPEAGFYNLMPAHGTVLRNIVKIPRSFNPGDPDFDKYHKRNYSVGYSFEHRFNEIFSLNQNFRYLNQEAYIRGLFADNGLIPPAPNGTELGRFVFFNDGSFANIHVDSQGHAKFDTGPVRHQVTIGVDYQRIRSRHVFMGNFCDPPASPAPCQISINNPVYGQPIPYPDFLFGTSSKDREHQIGLYAQDQIRFGNWAFLFGGRQDWVRGSSTSLRFFDTTKISDNAFTWRAGLVYLFEMGLAPYFSYSESFQPEFGSDFFGNPFKPTSGQQYEVGVKYQPKGVKSFITLAAFHIRRQNVVTDDPDPDHPFASVQTGEVRSRGVELEGHMSVTDDLDLVASYTFTDVKNTKSNTENLKKAPTGIPEHSAAFWANYKIPFFPFEGLQAGAGVRFVGQSFGDQGNTFKVPSYTLVDAALRYDLVHLRSELRGWQLGVSGTNIFDKTYVSQCLGLNDCSYGLARRVFGNVIFKW